MRVVSSSRRAAGGWAAPLQVVGVVVAVVVGAVVFRGVGVAFVVALVVPFLLVGFAVPAVVVLF
jgi:hypothetical protein